MQGQIIPIGLSIGVAVYPHDGADTITLLANADAALYRAKESGRKTVRFFDPDIDRRLRERFALQIDLRSAIARNELRPALPAAGEDRRRGLRLRGAGALAASDARAGTADRLHHARRAERHDRRDRRLGAEGGVPRGGVLAAAAAGRRQPVARCSSATATSPASCISILLETGLAPGRLELEITEGVIFDDPSRALSILRRLKALGVKIAMDDFGTGYASMSSLQSFPFDKIKIDRSFVTGVENDPQSAAIVRSIIGLGAGARRSRSSPRASRPRASARSSGTKAARKSRAS